MLSPCSRVLITPGRQAERRVGLSVHTFFSFATFNSFCAVEPYVLRFIKNIINSSCLNTLLLICLLYHREERLILYFYLLPMNQDFFFQKWNEAYVILQLRRSQFPPWGLVISDCFHSNGLDWFTLHDDLTHTSFKMISAPANRQSDVPFQNCSRDSLLLQHKKITHS